MGIPVARYTIEMPEILLDSERVHNRLVKEIVKEEAFKHWRGRIPQHFRQGTQKKYNFAPRMSFVGKLPYNAWKARKFRSRTDLVKTGATKREMENNAQIIVSGAASGGKRAIAARIVLKFPFGGGSGRFKKESRQSQLIMQLASEISRVTMNEAKEISLSIGDQYVRKLNSPAYARKRRKVTV